MLRQYYGIISACVALSLHFIAAFTPYSIIDIFYTNGLYVLLKWILWPFQWLPIHGILLIILSFTLLIFRNILLFLKRKRAARVFIRSLLNIAGVVITLFYLFWGLNYRGKPIRAYLPIEEIKVDTTELQQFYALITREIIQTRNNLHIESIVASANIDDLQTQLLSAQLPYLSEFGYPTKIPARVRYLPEGALLRISTAGFYFPFAGEGYIDRGLHPLVIPHVLAHELAHNFGVTDEGEANFIALRSCLSVENPYIRYSGLLDLWRYISGSLKFACPNYFQKAYRAIPGKIKADLEAIRKQHNSYPDILPSVRDFIYDHYLKAQGVEAGLTSYAEVILLEMAYRQQEKTN